MTKQLRIEHVKFRAGSSAHSTPLAIAIPNVTVLVGPNNSGKSATLREIERQCRGERERFQLVDRVEVLIPDTFDDLMEMFNEHVTIPRGDRVQRENMIWVARPSIHEGEERTYHEVDIQAIQEAFDEQNSQFLREQFVRLFTLRLDGRTRFDLLDPKPAGSLEKPPENHLWALFIDDESRAKVSNFTYDAFGSYFVVDPTAMSQFRARLSDR